MPDAAGKQDPVEEVQGISATKWCGQIALFTVPNLVTEYVMKRCPHCDTEKSLDEFYKRSNGQPQSWCKRCILDHQKIRVATDEGRAQRRKSQREWAKRNPEKVKAKKRVRRLRDRQAVLEAYGGECQCCGEKEERFLTVDHIDGRDPNHPDKNNLYRYLVREGFPKNNYRLFCWNCNCGRQVNGGICPHEELIPS